jgi:hypothetical protein
MSKSIKQYKDAMGKIKISDSFEHRTEAMLREACKANNPSEVSAIPAEKPEAKAKPEMKRSEPAAVPVTAARRKNKIRAAFSAAAAACIAAFAIFGVKYMTDMQNTTTTTTEYDYAYSEAEVFDEEEEETYYEPNESDESLENAIADIPDKGSDLDGGIAEAQTSAADVTSSEDKASTEKDDAPAEAAPVESPPPADESTASSSNGNSDNMPESGNPGAVGYESEDGLLSEAIFFADDLDYDSVNFDIIFYSVDPDSGVSLSSDAVVTDTAQMKNIAETMDDVMLSCFMAGRTTSSHLNYDVEFIVYISSDENRLNTVYLTDNNALIVTAHTSSGQERTAYMLTSEEYKTVEKLLYGYFGTESEYEAFCAYKSGK